jgi:GrpB-like predicted nucleotidyltransferase (UPF0157 family)
MMLFPELVLLKPYDPAWRAQYERESQLLRQIFAGPGVVIEHVGSTAVEDLGAKPIVDIMIGVDSLVEIELNLAAIAEMDYKYLPEFEAELPERRFFRKLQAGHHMFHLHCACTDSDFFRDHILFRDYLRSSKDAAQEYFALKERLSMEFRNDRPGYTKYKTNFIQAKLNQARAEQPG